MAISVYDIFDKQQEIEDLEDRFRRCIEMLPVDCDRGAKAFKALGDVIQQAISDNACVWPLEVSRLSFMSTLYNLKSKALEIERLFYKFRSVCLDDSSKKESSYEKLYRNLRDINKDLGNALGELPPRLNKELQEAMEVTGDESNPQPTPQSIPPFTRTSTSTF